MRIIDSIYKINKNDILKDEYNINKIRCSKTEAISFQIALKLDSEINDIDLKITTSNEAKIYFEYYHKISVVSTMFVSKGEYPDCLVPYDLFIKNKLYKSLGSNDNLIFNVNLNIKNKCSENLIVDLKINGKKYQKSLLIEALDIDLGNEIKYKTLFGIFPEMYDSSYDYSLDSYIDYYNDLLNEYRISSNKIVASYDKFLLLIDRIIDLNSNNLVSSIPLPVIKRDDGEYDMDYLYNTLKRLISLSILNDTNYLKKLLIYNFYLDEPEPDKFNEVFKYKRDVDRIKSMLSSLCESKDLLSTLMNIPNITTVFYRSDLYDKVDTWCPTYVAFQKPELVYEYNMRQRYGDKSFWYGCVWPMHPYPNFHIDDDLINIRALAYMQFYYNISGNLYWAVNIDKIYDLDKKEYKKCNLLENPMVFPPANGDGYLTYPGYLFNSKMPLASLRLDTIKNSIYDYQYLISLEDNLIRLAKKYNLSYKRENYFKPIFRHMFHGVITYRNYDVFNKINDLIKNLIILSKDNIYISFSDLDYTYVYSDHNISLDNEVDMNGYYKYKLENKDYIINNINICNKKLNRLSLIDGLRLKLSNKERFIINLDKNINIDDYFNILIDISTNSINPFSLNFYAVNQYGIEWPIGYDIISGSGVYNIAIDLKNTSYYADIDSTAICSRYNLYKPELERFLKGSTKSLAIEANDYRTFNDKEGRFKGPYEFVIKECMIEEIR